MMRRARANSPLPPPPPPPPAHEEWEGKEGGNTSSRWSSALAPHDELLEKLSTKVRQQARILIELQSDVEERQRYALLCEQYVVTLVPCQPLPLSRADLQSLRARKQHEEAEDHGKVNRTSRHTLTTITRQYDATCQRLREEASRRGALEEEVAKSSEAREFFEKKCASLRKKLNDAHARIAQLKKGAPLVSTITKEGVDKLQNNVEKLRAKNKRLLMSLEAEMQLNEEERARIQVLESSLRKRAEELQLDPEKLHELETNKFEVLATRASIAKLTKAKSDLEQQNETLEEKVRLQALQIEHLKGQVVFYESDEQTNDALGSLRLRNKALKEENDSLVDFMKETVEPLRKEAKELQQSLDDTVRSLNEMSEKLKLVESEKAILESEVDCFKMEVKGRELDLSEASGLADRLKIQVQHQEDTMESLKIKLRAEESKNEVLSKQNEKLVALEKLKQDFAEARQTLLSERKELVNTQARLKEARAELETAQAESENLRTQVSKLNRVEQARNSLANELAATTKELRSTIEEIRVLKAELVPMKEFKSRVEMIETQIRDFWSDAFSDETKILNLDDFVQRKGIDQALDLVLPNIYALLSSTRTQLKDMNERMEINERVHKDESERTIAEKTLLREQIREVRKQWQAASARLKREVSYEDLHKKYIELQLKLAAFEQCEQQIDLETEDKNTEGSTVLRQVEEVTNLKRDLERAAHLVQEHEAIVQRIETQLMETEDQLHFLRNDVEISKRLAHSTVKGVHVRFRNSHIGVHEYFESTTFVPFAESSTMEECVIPLCELLEKVLQVDMMILSPQDVRKPNTEEEEHEIVVTRTNSPAQIRVARNGAIEVKTQSPRAQSASSGIDFTQECLQRPADKLEQIDRIRKHSSRRPETPLARQYKLQYKIAQEKFRKLQEPSFS